MRLLNGFYEIHLSDEEIVSMMREDGITYQEIANYTQWDRKKVSDYAATLAITSLPISMAATNKASEGFVRCAICIKIVRREKMPVRLYEDKPIYHLLLCKECLLVDPSKNALEANSLARKLARKEKATRQENKVTLKEIPNGYFAFLYTQQKGLCFYTDAPLEFNERKNLVNNISTDRIIYDGLYEQGNIVFSTNKVNVVKNDMTLDEMKEWTPSWHARIETYYKNKKLYLMEENNG